MMNERMAAEMNSSLDEPEVHVVAPSRVRCIVTAIAKGQLVQMGVRETDCRHLPRANNLWEVLVDADWFDRIHHVAQGWNCTFSEAVGHVLNQELP